MITLTKTEFHDLATDYHVSYHEALLLLANVLKIEYSKLFFKKTYNISKKHYKKLQLFLSRRTKGEPIAKIIEKKEFYGFKFKTTRDTLDPRPETELLIDLFKSYYLDISANLRILDLGSGTGCIGITLLKIYNNATCCFADISANALKVAQRNAETHQVQNRSKFLISDWFSKITEKFDAITSNPPYVAINYALDQETIHDPKIALFAGDEGMDAYKIILPNASKYLNPSGLLLLEIGYDQSEKIKRIHSDLKLLRIEKDITGINRACVFGLL